MNNEDSATEMYKTLIGAALVVLAVLFAGSAVAVGAPEQYSIPQDVQDEAVRNALSNLTPQLWAMVGLMFAGIFAGMIVVGITRRVLRNIDGDGPRAWESRSRFLFLLGAIVSGLITFWIEWAYLHVLVNLSWVLALPASLLAALGAAGLNHPLFKPVKALWRWRMEKLRKRIEQDGHSAPDLDDTRYRK